MVFVLFIFVVEYLIEVTANFLLTSARAEELLDLDATKVPKLNNSMLNTSSRDNAANNTQDFNTGEEQISNESMVRCPTETWVDCMKFMDRDNLQTMKLVSSRFEPIVDKYFGIYPFRRIERCRVTSNARSNCMKVLLICIENGKTVETNSDLHNWFQNSFVECIEFIDFKFSSEFLFELLELDMRTLKINYCVLEYSKKKVVISQEQIDILFSVAAFRGCIGAVFNFDKRCAFRPQIMHLLKLPLNSMVIDLDDYKPTESDNLAIRSWLNGNEQIKNAQLEAVALSLRGTEYGENFSILIEMLREDFMRATRKRSYILNIDWIEDWDHERSEYNQVTGEKFFVNVSEGRVVIRRE